tara:strand:- start:4348 stop:4758 length:411 start_codon:yes stop_codon:yes gene_type:complete
LKDLIKHKLEVAQYGSTSSVEQDGWLYRKRSQDSCYKSYNLLNWYQNTRLPALVSDHDTARDNGNITKAETISEWFKQAEETLAIIKQDHEADLAVFKDLHGEEWTNKPSTSAKVNHLTPEENKEVDAKMSKYRAS